MKLNWGEVDQLIAEYTEEGSSSKLVSQPLVSVCFITYNHAKFIEEALDSVLAQKADFPYEIVIGDDASTDGAMEIIGRYQNADPDKIKVLKSTKNLGGVTGKSFLPNMIRNLSACRGKYIAFLEGDDYWTDPLKLQKQVDYLESHPAAAGCFGDCIIVDDTGAEINPRPFWNDAYEQSYDQLACLANLVSCYGTAALVFRSKVIDNGLPDYFLMAGSDFLLDLVVTEYGSLEYLPGVITAYRIHEGGIWQGTKDSDNAISMVTRICWLYINESFTAKHEGALKSVLQKWSSIFSQYAQREHLSLYDAVSSYLSATSPLLPLRYFPLVNEELSNLFDQRWHDDSAVSHPLGRRLREIFRLYRDFPAARSFIVSKLSHYALLCIKRRLRLG